MGEGALRCRTIVLRGRPLKISRAGEWGVKPASAIRCVLCTWSDMLFATTKKS